MHHDVQLINTDRGVQDVFYRLYPANRSALLTLIFVALTMVSSVSAQQRVVFQVNSSGDGGDAAPGNGVCETATGNGVCTLRAAIQEANANTNQTIGIGFNIPTSDFNYDPQTGTWRIDIISTLVLNKNSRLNPSGVVISIGGPVVINGLSGGGGGRIFNVTTPGTVNLSGLTIKNGDASFNENGGGIQNVNGGTVNISNCTLTGNRVTDEQNNIIGGGGAIFNASSGTINITNSTLRSNHANTFLRQVVYGGAIWNRTGTVNISGTLFDSNKSGYEGGAIANESGTVTISGSTFYGNAAFYGGGIFSRGGTVSITNSTFFANIADDPIYDGFGAAILTTAGGILNLTNSTVSANSSAFGGALYNEIFNNAAPAVNVKSSVIAGNYGNTLDASVGPDVYGPFTSQGFNLIGKKEGSTGFTLATDKKGTIASPMNPKFDPKGLRNNGGPTPTLALANGSPAIDKGTSVGLTGTLFTDQRGFARTVEKSVADATGGDGTDIGAFEVP